MLIYATLPNKFVKKNNLDLNHLIFEKKEK